MAKGHPIVIVEWEDAFGSDDCFEPDCPTVHRPYLRRSVGFLMQMRPRYILAMTEDIDRTSMQTPLVLPRGIVRKVTPLKEDV